MVPAPSPILASPRLVLFSRSMTQPPLIESLHPTLESSPDVQYRVADSFEKVREAISHSTRVVLLANCLTQEDVADLYDALPTFKTRATDGTLRILVLNSARHPKLPELLRSRCMVEVLELPLTLKNIQYKIKNSVISVHQNYLKKSQEKDSKPIGSEVLWQPSVEFDFDFWWIASEKQIRRIVGVWLVDLVGPGPSAGSWEEVPRSTRGAEKGWMWRPRWLADEAFQTAMGHWIFFGNQPEFSNEKGAWSFVSKSPMLGYFPNGAHQPTYTRFEYKPDEGMIFFENSHFTQILLPRILATFEKSIPLSTPRANQVPNPAQIPDFDAENSGAERSVLVPGSQESGLEEVKIAGVASGARAFDKMSFGVDIVRKNGKLGTADLLPPKVYEVTRTGATLMLEPPTAQIGDRFHFRFHLDSGDKHTECLMEWELLEIEMEFENQLLATGDFISGDFGPLDYALNQLEERKNELREFYKTARE